MIRLEPWPASEKEAFYQLSCHSDATASLYGQAYGDEVPTYEALFNDYLPHYFDDSDPAAGRCFGIWLGDERIGQVNYNAIDPESRSTELDIWIGDRRHWGKGYATKALRQLLEKLFGHLGVQKAVIFPLESHTAARSCYAKAGFRTITVIDREGVRYLQMEQNAADFYGISALMKTPYYAVIFTSLRTEGDHAYSAMAETMDELARRQPGYLGIESVRDQLGITISYWENEEAIRQWKQQLDHRQAQQMGRARWYAAYRVRVCRVERDYNFFTDDTGEST